MNLVAGRQLLHAASEIGAIECDPVRCGFGRQHVLEILEILALAALLANADDIAAAHQERRDIGLALVHGEVTVSDELSSGLPGLGETHPVDDIVQPGLQDLEQVVTGHTTAAGSLNEVTMELTLKQAIEAADLLLLTKLKTVFRRPPGAALTVLAGRKIAGGRALHDRALRSLAARSLQVELQALAPAKPADWPCVSRHVEQ